MRWAPGRKPPLMKQHLRWIALSLLTTTVWAQETNVARNPGFEDADLRVAWTNFGTALIGLTTNAFAGTYAAVASNRAATTAGIAQDMRGQLVSGVTYWASAWVRVGQSDTATSTVALTMKEDYAGSAAKYTTIRSTTFISNGWQRLAGVFRYKPTAAEEAMDFYINGPAAAYPIYVDDVHYLAPMLYTPPTNSLGTDFVRAQGTNLVVGDPARKINLRGVNLTAYSDDDEDPVEDYMTQARWDYERIADTGMNVVRLNLWQKFWDDYTLAFSGYKQEGWEWLERQIVWARENNLYLLLDMHAPAGGYQGPDYATPTRFWGTSATATTNRWRLKQFWVALADRYQHEPVLEGYDFINEPCPQNEAQWESYALELVDAVRAVDTNHLLDVEVAINFAEPFVLPRSNIMYDFHSYDPWRFSYQLHHISGYGDQGIWGETNMPAIGWDYTAGAVTNSRMAPSGSFGWTRYTSGLVRVTATNAIALEPVLISVSSGGTITFDDFTINEYDPSGAFVRECMIVNPETAPGNVYLESPVYPLPTYNSAWTKAGAGTFSTTTNDPHLGARAFTVSGIATMSNGRLMFPVRKDYQYRVEAWLRGTNLTTAGSGLGFRHYTRPEWEMGTWARRDFLETTLRGYGWDFWKSNNVPVNLGEFGISQMAIRLNRGGLVWLDDVLDLADEHNVNWNYYVYKSTIYGLYVNAWGSGGRPDYRNAGLADYFTSRLGGRSTTPSPLLTHTRVADGGTVLTWNPHPGRGYTILFSTNLLSPGLTLLATNVEGGAYTDALHAAEPLGFYGIGTR